MSHALHLFRDSLAERARLEAVAEHQRRTLQQAIECLNEGFVLYGPDDRLVLCNSRYHAFYAGIADIAVPAARFPPLRQEAVARRMIDLDGQYAAQWIEQRLKNFAAPRGAFEYRIGERWLHVDERKTHDGGTVAIHTDITELKQRQVELEEAKVEAEHAT